MTSEPPSPQDGYPKDTKQHLQDMLAQRTSEQQGEIDRKENVANMNTERKITEMEAERGTAAGPGRFDADKAVVEEPEEMVEEPTETGTENEGKEDK
jgi:hypothetical protein